MTEEVNLVILRAYITSDKISILSFARFS